MIAHRMSFPPGLVSYSTGTARSTCHRLASGFGPTVHDVAAQGVRHSPLPFLDASVDWLAACCRSSLGGRPIVLPSGGRQKGWCSRCCRASYSFHAVAVVEYLGDLAVHVCGVLVFRLRPMRLGFNDMRIPSELEVPTRWLLMTYSLSLKNCRSSIPLQSLTGQEPSGPARRRGIDSSRRTLTTANRNHDAAQVKALISSAPRVCRCSSSKQYTTHHRTASIRIEENEKMVLQSSYLHACKGEGILFGEKQKQKTRHL